MKKGILKKHILLLILLGGFLKGYSQRCGTDNYLRALQNMYPYLVDTINNQKARSMESVNADAIIYIPVVVHIIHNGVTSITNISDAQVNSQINILNQDFSTIQGTSGLGVDTKIRFCLAQKDPLGNPTTGITRDLGSQAYYRPFDAADNSFEDNIIKGYSPWPYTKYLNLWVCDIRNFDLTGTLYGYATFPYIGGVYDGVVINYETFGNIGTGLTYSDFNKGRTTTHEVGHWLGLWHTFQDEDCVNADCTLDGDQVCDTDPVPGAAWDDAMVSSGSCALRQNCSLATISAENYMDYNFDQCMSFFTAGQKDRMRQMLNTYRSYMYSTSITNPSALPIECSQPDDGSSSPGGIFYCGTTLGANQGFFVNGWIQPQIEICATDPVVINFGHNDTCVHIPKCWTSIDCSDDPGASLWQQLFGNNCGEDQWHYFVAVYYDCDENYSCANSYGQWFDMSASGSNNIYTSSLNVGPALSFNFERGKYYMIKLAGDYNCSYSGGWQEQFKKIYIEPENNLAFNNSTLNPLQPHSSIPNGTYQAIQTITVQNSNTAVGSNVKMIAGVEIDITETTLNPEFQAYIQSPSSCQHTKGFIAMDNSNTDVANSQTAHLNSDSRDDSRNNLAYQESDLHNWSAKENVTIFPNPNNGILQISVTRNNAPMSVKEIKIYDILGTVVWESYSSSNTIFDVDISSLSSGIYYLKCINTLGEIEVKKIIKK